MNQILKSIKQIFIALTVLIALIGISSCEKYSYTIPAVSLVDTLHFSTDIQPIFNANCTTCHGATKAPDLREGKSFQALTKGSYITLPGETSELYTKMTGSDHSPKSTDQEKQKVLIWINQGALNN